MAKKIKGKEWYTLVAPKMFSNKVIGEVLITNPKQILGRTVTENITNLGGHPSKYYLKVKFKVDEIKENLITTKFVGHECLRDYISQMIRKRSTRIDIIDTVKTKDNKKLIVKIVTVTIRKIQQSVRTSIRKRISELLKEQASKTKLDNFVKDIVSDKVQKKIKDEVNKIYPLRRLEVRMSKVVE